MSSKLPNRLKVLREEAKYTQENVAAKIGVTPKTYRTWEKDFEKMKSGVKSVNLIALASLYNVSIDYILGLSNCRSVSNHYISQKTGLNDGAIDALIQIKLADENEKRNKHIPDSDSIISLVDIMNFTFKRSIETILTSIRDFISARYKIPVYYESETGKWICPKSNFEFSEGELGFPDIWWLNLASNENTLYDNKPIMLSDTFFEMIALKDIEKHLYTLRTLYYEEQS